MLQARARCAACRQGLGKAVRALPVYTRYILYRAYYCSKTQGGAGRERGDTHRSERGPGPSNTTLRHRPPHRPEPRPGHTRIGPGTKRSGQHGPETTQGAGTHTGDWNKNALVTANVTTNFSRVVLIYLVNRRRGKNSTLLLRKITA